MVGNETKEVVFSFDTTGSMYPCLTQVRRRVEETIRRLFAEDPNMRIGLIAHGDYCDERSSYVTKTHPLSRDVESLCSFVRTVEPTGGGDAPECYELVLHEARSLGWTDAKAKVLVLIGDDIPHGPHERQNKKKLDWRNELALLLKMGVSVYGVQALNRRHATHFYEEIARVTGGYHLSLDQFSSVIDLLTAICYRQMGSEQLQQFELEVERSGRMDRSLDAAFATLSGRVKPKAVFSVPTSLEAVPAGRFQMLSVERDQPIREFVEANGLVFQKGRGFYEFTKTETIQGGKEVVLVHRVTGDKFSGAKAREMIGAPPGEKVRIKPTLLADYIVFVQSTSYNRKLEGGTRFLYEVDMDR